MAEENREVVAVLLDIASGSGLAADLEGVRDLEHARQVGRAVQVPLQTPCRRQQLDREAVGFRLLAQVQTGRRGVSGLDPGQHVGT